MPWPVPKACYLQDRVYAAVDQPTEDPAGHEACFSRRRPQSRKQRDKETVLHELVGLIAREMAHSSDETSSGSRAGGSARPQGRPADRPRPMPKSPASPGPWPAWVSAATVVWDDRHRTPLCAGHPDHGQRQRPPGSAVPGWPPRSRNQALAALLGAASAEAVYDILVLENDPRTGPRATTQLAPDPGPRL
jgi:hypothetical protein